MKRDITRSAEKRLRSIADRRATEFDASIIHNVIHDRLTERDSLRALVDLAERAYKLDERDTLAWEVDQKVGLAAADIDDVIETQVDSEVDDILRELDERLDGFGDAWDEESIATARDELDRYFSEQQEADSDG